jgi:hypothetical protein
MKAASDPARLASAQRDPPSPQLWNIPAAPTELQESSRAYYATLKQAAATPAGSTDNRKAVELFARATVLALDDITVVCAGER